MATPPNEAAKLAILRQQMLDKIKQDEQYKQMTDRQYTGAIQPNPNWMPKKAEGGGMSKGGLEKFLEPSKIKGRMYHGTVQDIREFKPHQANSVFVTDNPDTAHFFAENSEYNSKYNGEGNPEGGGQNIMPVHVQVTNPFDFENLEHMKALRDYEKANRYTDRSISNYIGSVNGGDWEAIESRKIQNALKHLSHDAFYVRENGRKNLGIHDPRKIKSAIGNRGTYDTNEHDITKANGGVISQDAMQLALMPKVQSYPKPVTHAHQLEIEERPL